MIHSMPSYLQGLVAEVDSEIFAEIQTEYGEYSTAFKFNTKFRSLRRTWHSKYNDFGLTIWGVNTNEETICIFNPLENGYNGLFDLNKKEDVNSIKVIEFENAIELIIVFQYGGDETEYAQEGKSEFTEDYFDWLVIYKWDMGKLEKIIDIECA